MDTVQNLLSDLSDKILTKKNGSLLKNFGKVRFLKDKGDIITVFDAHNHGWEVFTKEILLEECFRDPVIDKKPCYLIFDVL